MVSITIVAALILACAVQVELGDVPERTCGTLFSLDNFGGEFFTLNDFDQSPNLKKEYRHSRDGWTVTKSIKVQDGCTMTTCSDTYLTGSCQSFTSKDAPPSQLLSTIKSANCTCERSCRCEDFYITEDELASSMYSPAFIGRAYHKGGCDTCDSEYTILLEEGNPYFKPVDQKSPVMALILHRDCSITFFTQQNYKGDALSIISGPVYRGRPGTLGSYNVTCQSSNTKPESELKNYLALDDLPMSSKALHEMLLSNQTLANHQGIKAVLDSVQINRSSRRVYVMVIGEQLPQKVGFRTCTRKYNTTTTLIRECGIPVDVDNLGISTELRVITIRFLMYNIASSMKDVNAYLSSHEELNHKIPNVVIFATYIHYEEISKETNELQQSLKAIKEFRHRLIDANYPNIIFNLRSLQAFYPIEERRKPEARVAEFEAIIRGQLDFLNPVAFALSSGPQITALYHMNGYAQIDNGEFWPRNLEVGLVNICEKSGDTLGRSVLGAFFQNILPPRSNTRPVRILEDRLSAGDSSGNNDGTAAESSNGKDNRGPSVDEAIHDGTNDGQDIHYGANDGQGIDVGDYPDHTEADYTLLDPIDQDCGCVAVSTELKQKIDQLKSEIEVERTERLIDADRAEADIWEKLKLKWRVHFEL